MSAFASATLNFTQSVQASAVPSVAALRMLVVVAFEQTREDIVLVKVIITVLAPVPWSATISMKSGSQFTWTSVV